MNKDINKDNIHPETLGKISGGAGRDFDMEYWQQYFRECEETAKESNQHQPDPHSKKEKGKLYR